MSNKGRINWVGVFITFIVFLLVFSMNNINDQINTIDYYNDNPTPIDDYEGNPFVETNFNLKLIIPAGSRRDESYALYIKQALAPLGINLDIFAKPWGQFAGEIFTNHSNSYDMFLGGFDGREFSPRYYGKKEISALPDLRWLYHSDYNWANAMHHLNANYFDLWQLDDTGVNQSELNQLLTDIDLEFNMTLRKEKFQELNDLYFDKLLYNLPLISPESRITVWSGYGGSNDELWDTREGVIESRAYGAKWENNRPTRAAHSNLTTFRYAVNSPEYIGMDPYQVSDSESRSILKWINGATIDFDGDWGFRPDWSWQFMAGDFNETKLVDHDNDWSTDPVLTHVYRVTVFLRDDAIWSDTVDKDGNEIKGRPINANDLELYTGLFDYFQQRDDLHINGEEIYDQIVGWELNSTLRANDTFSVFLLPNTLVPEYDIQHVKIGAYPSHLLGRLGSNLTIVDGDNITQFTTSPGLEFNPFDSEEWNSYESFKGNTAIGPYEMVEKVDEQYYSYKQREDYYYPNLWDLERYYGNGSLMQKWELLYDFDFQSWGGNRNKYPQEASRWTYGDLSETLEIHEKPSTQNIETLYAIVIDDDNAELIEFEAGGLDVFNSAKLGAEVVSRHQNSVDLISKTVYPEASARMLFFNLENEHLKKINIRKAINFVIDRQSLINIHEGFASEWWSMAFVNKRSYGINWDDVQSPINYSYEYARDLMRLEGYHAADTNVDGDYLDVGIIVPLTEDSSYPILFSFLGIIVINLIFKKIYRQY